MDEIVVRHTMPAQLAGIFSKVSLRLPLFSHSPGTAAIVDETRRSYPGPEEVSEDFDGHRYRNRGARDTAGRCDSAAMISRQ